MERYSRHIALNEIGHNGQQRINESSVLVIGAGGLGCPALQYLAAAGVGHIGIVDFDLVELSNLQRQVLFGTNDLGKNKAKAAKQALTHLNPEIRITAFDTRLTANNALDLMRDFDIILDGTDNFESRYIINDAALILGKPLVYGAIFKFEGQVSVFNYEEGPSYRCLFPNPPPINSIPNCAETGVLGVLPGIIGSMQANEVLKIILKIGKVLSGLVYCINTKTMSSYTFELSKRDEQTSAVIKRGMGRASDYKTASCELEVPSCTIDEAQSLENCHYLDVRNPDEQPKTNWTPIIEIPLDLLEAEIHKLHPNINYLVFCQSGNRSAKAVEILRGHGFLKTYNLSGGLINLNLKEEKSYEA